MGDMIEAARQTGVKFILTTAHVSAAQGRNTEFARMYQEVEHLLRGSNIPYCVLFTEVFMDVHLTDAANVKRTSSFYYTMKPDVKFNPIALQDVAEIAARILLHPGPHQGKRYCLTGPASISMTDIATVYSNVRASSSFIFIASLLLRGP